MCEIYKTQFSKAAKADLQCAVQARNKYLLLALRSNVSDIRLSKKADRKSVV